jgi:hypothetical protein
MAVAPDISVFSKNQGFDAYQRANEAFQMQKALQAAQIQKLAQPDIDELGKQAFLKASTGAQLSPQETAALSYLDSKTQNVGFNPVTGALEAKPSLLQRAGVNVAQPTSKPLTGNANMSASDQAQAINGLYGDAPPTTEPLTPKSKQVQQESRIKQQTEREAGYTKAQSALQGFGQQAKLVTDTIDKALTVAQSPTATGYGQVFSSLPNTDSRALNNYLATIKSNVGFDKLQNMRDNSPTGGALGQVSDMVRLILCKKTSLLLTCKLLKIHTRWCLQKSNVHLNKIMEHFNRLVIIHNLRLQLCFLRMRLLLLRKK